MHSSAEVMIFLAANVGGKSPGGQIRGAKVQGQMP